MKKIIVFLICFIQLTTHAQVDSSLFKRVTVKDTSVQMNVDATYNRPFLTIGKTPVAIGGYLEANTNYAVTDGVSEGLSFQMRRMTIFLSSAIGKRIRFLSEIEFEDGTKEINIEFAAMDIEFHPMFNFRGGIIMNPIGSFNQNHDGPKWEFIDRPISATTIIPATWSNVGFGLWGKYSKNKWGFAYEAYLSNGFDDRIIDNNLNRTNIPASKLNPDRFEESYNGVPLTTVKTAFGHRRFGEFGISWMGGIYNKFQEDGLILDSKRRVDLIAIDFNTVLPVKTAIRGEWVWAFIDVPSTYSQQYGQKQRGGFVDIVQPVLKRTMLGFEKAVLNACVRFEYSDYNVGTFNETGTNIGDHIYAVVPAISFRPFPQTVLRANYRYSWTRDVLNNPPSKTAAFQFGFSTYF